ncbi:MAG TPA: putative aminohydrolase SsnA [Anaerolineaceae bacterium]|nr:putative aminohydrolase SsnA [Anaerolineaceae bacterium]
MLIFNGKLVTWGQENKILEDQALLIQDGVIQAIGPKEEMLAGHPDEERLDAHSQYVMPGNICAHTHFYGAFSRGLSIPGKAAQDFPEILAKVWWPLDRSLTFEDVRYSALVCLVDAIRHGTTTLIDHHASPEAIDGSLDEIAQAVEQAGLRAGLCYEVTDRNGPEQARAGIAENKRFIEYVDRERPLNGRLAAMFGLHASLTLSDETLRACREAVGDQVGFHVHVAEHPSDQYDAISKSGMRAIDRLNHFGILGPRTIAVHCVHVDAREIAQLAETRTWVSHQPRSNMNNAVGLPEVESMMRAGVRVCLGNDGFSNAMWEEWKTAYLAHKLVHRDPRRLGADRVVEMAVVNNAALAEQLFPGAPIGVIAPGARADLIFVDYHPFTPLTADNLPWQIIFGFHESMITTTIVDGRLLMHDRQLLTLDEEKIAAHARKLAPDAWQRFWNQFNN